MSSVSVLIDLHQPGLVIGDLTVTCQKVSDKSAVSSAGCTLSAFDAFGLYWLTHPSITELTEAGVRLTSQPDNYFHTLLDPHAGSGVGRGAVVVDLHQSFPVFTIGDLTVTCQKVSDRSTVDTSGCSLLPFDSNGLFWLSFTGITERCGYCVRVTAQPDNYYFGYVDRMIAAGDTIRKQILNALAARLATITTASGYRTNLGQNVQEWDVTPLDPDLETLRIEYRDEAGTTGYEAVGEHLHTLPVTLRIVCKANDGTALATVRNACADVYQAIYADVTFGGLAQDTNQEGSIREDYGEKADRSAGAEVVYRIEYTTAPGTP